MTPSTVRRRRRLEQEHACGSGEVKRRNRRLAGAELGWRRRCSSKGRRGRRQARVVYSSMAAPTRGRPGLGGPARKATMTTTARQGGGVVAATAMLARGRQRSGRSCDEGFGPAGSGEEGRGTPHADKTEWRSMRSAMGVCRRRCAQGCSRRAGGHGRHSNDHRSSAVAVVCSTSDLATSVLHRPAARFSCVRVVRAPPLCFLHLYLVWALTKALAAEEIRLVVDPSELF